MERNNNNNLSNNLKDHSLGGSKSCYYYSSSNNKVMLKSPWEYSGTSSSRSSNPNGSYGDQDYGKYMGQQGLFSWPPRSYTCSFCKREFRSAQALGGHMNVHRRDRARLRVHEIESSPNSSTRRREDFNLNLTPSPPNPSLLTTPPPPPLSSLASGDCSGILRPKAVKSLFGECDVMMTMKARDHDRVLGVDLGIGLFRGDRFKEDLDLDLELRLGW